MVKHPPFFGETAEKKLSDGILRGTFAHRACVLNRCSRFLENMVHPYNVVLKKITVRALPLFGFQERALEATRERLRSELGELALKRSTLINGNFREMPPELEPESVQLVV